MKIATVFVCLLALGVSPAFSSTLSYRMAIDGDFATTQAPLLIGTHTLTVEAIVTDNVIAGGFDGGLLQSSFNLATNNGGFKFTDATGGFLGGPNGQWDSADLIPPWDVHFRAVTTNGGGPTATEETFYISPSDYNTKFQNVGANVYSMVGQGTFNFAGGSHPLSFNLTSTPSITRVAGFNGTQIVAVAPTTVNGYSINFGAVDPPTPDPPKGTVDYRLLIDGVEADRHDIVPGTHTLEVEVRVTHNLLAGSFAGGLLQSKFNLDDPKDAIRWSDAPSGFIGNPAGDGKWDSANLIPPFDVHQNGVLAGSGETEVIGETHLVSPTNYNDKFMNIGAEVYSRVARGGFTWNGTPTRLDLSFVDPYGGDIRVGAFNGTEIFAGIPLLVNGASTFLGVPEPSGAVLGSLLGACIAGMRARRCLPRKSRER